jgi:hypothetical protein
VPIEAGRKMEELVLSGEIPAAIGVQIDSPDVARLIPNATEAALEALRKHAFYPINHTVVVRDELLAAQPNLAADIFHVFAEAKRPYVRKLAEGGIPQPSKDDEVFRRVMEITGDPLPYGIAPNRRMLEAIVQYATEQRIIPRAVAVEELFPRSTHALTA